MDRPREPLPTRVRDTPALPAAYADALDAGLSALALELTPEARAFWDPSRRALTHGPLHAGRRKAFLAKARCGLGIVHSGRTFERHDPIGRTFKFGLQKTF